MKTFIPILTVFIILLLNPAVFGQGGHPVNKIYYVDKNNPNDPLENGSRSHPFDKIQEGIDAAYNHGVEGDMVINWQVFFDKQFSFLKPNQYMLYYAARYHAEKGIRFLNLGASPEGAESLDSYKKKWGGNEHRYNCNIYSSTIGRLL